MNVDLRKLDSPSDEGLSSEPAAWPGVDDADDEADVLADIDTAQQLASERGTRRGLPTASDLQLAAWIEAIVEQDERALALLYDATFSRVFGLVQRIVRNAALAEEVAEDAYFQVWRQAVRFDPARGKALTWLLSMARSRAIDTLRREARFQHDCLNEDDTAPEGASRAPPVDELLDLARTRADLHQALMLLGAQPRQLVSLAFFRGLSHEEIAEQTRLPLGTVKSQIRRALQSLQQILGPGGAAAVAP